MGYWGSAPRLTVLLEIRGCGIWGRQMDKSCFCRDCGAASIVPKAFLSSPYTQPNLILYQASPHRHCHYPHADTLHRFR